MKSFVEFAIKSENMKKWFSWLEWVTLCAALFVAGIKSNSMVTLLAMICLGFLSLFMLLIYSSAILLGPISRLLGSLKMPKIFVRPILVIISYGVPIFVFFALLATMLTIVNSMQ